MNFFGISNNILSIILYIATILVLVILGIVVSKILKKNINNIPEKKRTFLQKFLSDTIARNIIIIGAAFLILKFIIDPLFNYIFPAIAIGGSLLGGNNNDDQKEIEVNTNNNVENNNVNNNVENNNVENNNTNDNFANIEPLPSFMENDDEKIAEIPENVNNNEESTTENINVNNNDDEKTAEISENINVNNNEELTTQPINQSRPSFMEPLQTRPSFIENENNNIDLFPEEEKNQENIENNNINNEEEKNNTQIGGKKKIGRPKKIKSAAKVKLGKTNKWAIAVKRARKALGLTGFVPLNKGGIFYKTAKSFYYELTH